MKFDGLLLGWYGYQQDTVAAHTFLDEQSAKGKQWAIGKKINGFLDGKYRYKPDHQAVLRYFGIKIVNSQATASSSLN